MTSRLNKLAVPPLGLHTVSDLRTFGHSHGGFTGATSLEYAWPSRVAKALDAELIPRHLDGSVALYDDVSTTGDGGWDTVYKHLAPTRTAGPYIAAWPLVGYQFGHNDAALHGGETNFSKKLRHVLHAMVCRGRCAWIRENDAGSGLTYSSTHWTNLPVAYAASGTGIHYTSTTGATITAVIPSDFKGGTLYIGTVTGGKGGGATFSVTINGTPWNIRGPDTNTTTADTRDLTANTSELNRITISGAASGTYTITFNGQTTSGISFAATAATVQTAIENLSNVVPGEVSVTGGPGNTAPLNIEWTQGQRDTNHTVSADFTLVVGGTKTFTTVREGATTRIVGNVWRLENVPSSAAGQNMVLTVGTIQSFFYFDFFGIEARVPAITLLPLPFRLADYSGYSAFLYPLDDTAIGVVRQAVLDVAASFGDGRVLTPDFDQAVNKNADLIAGDGTHLNDEGHEVCAAVVLNTLQSKAPRDARSAVVLAQKAADPVMATTWKSAVRVAATANVTLGAPGATMDGVTLVANDRVLLPFQTTASENGIYYWTTATSALQRAEDANSSERLRDGTRIMVQEGARFATREFVLWTNGPYTLDTTSLSFQRTGQRIVELFSDVQNTTTSAADVTGLGIAVAASETIQFEYCLIIDAAATTTGIQLAMNGPTIGTGTFTAQIEAVVSTTAAALTTASPPAVLQVSAYETFLVGTSSLGTTRSIARIKGVLRNGTTAGTLIPRFKSEVAASAVNVRAGSWGEWR